MARVFAERRDGIERAGATVEPFEDVADDAAVSGRDDLLLEGPLGPVNRLADAFCGSLRGLGGGSRGVVARGGRLLVDDAFGGPRVGLIGTKVGGFFLDGVVPERIGVGGSLAADAVGEFAQALLLFGGGVVHQLAGAFSEPLGALGVPLAASLALLLSLGEAFDGAVDTAGPGVSAFGSPLLGGWWRGCPARSFLLPFALLSLLLALLLSLLWAFPPFSFLLLALLPLSFLFLSILLLALALLALLSVLLLRVLLLTARLLAFGRLPSLLPAFVLPAFFPLLFLRLALRPRFVLRWLLLLVLLSVLLLIGGRVIGAWCPRVHPLGGLTQGVAQLSCVALGLLVGLALALPSRGPLGHAVRGLRVDAPVPELFSDLVAVEALFREAVRGRSLRGGRPGLVGSVCR